MKNLSLGRRHMLTVSLSHSSIYYPRRHELVSTEKQDPYAEESRFLSSCVYITHSYHNFNYLKNTSFRVQLFFLFILFLSASFCSKCCRSVVLSSSGTWWWWRRFVTFSCLSFSLPPFQRLLLPKIYSLLKFFIIICSIGSHQHITLLHRLIVCWLSHNRRLSIELVCDFSRGGKWKWVFCLFSPHIFVSDRWLVPIKSRARCGSARCLLTVESSKILWTDGMSIAICFNEFK